MLLKAQIVLAIFWTILLQNFPNRLTTAVWWNYLAFVSSNCMKIMILHHFHHFHLGKKKSFISIYISRTSEPPSHTPIILRRARCWMCVPWVSPQLSPKDRPHGSPELSPSIPEADEILLFWGKSTGKAGIFMPQILAGFQSRFFWPFLGRCEPILGCLLASWTSHDMIWWI